MSFNRFYTFPNNNSGSGLNSTNPNNRMNYQHSMSHSNSDIYRIVDNTNHIINLQSQIITNLNSNTLNLTQNIRNMENNIEQIKSKLDELLDRPNTRIQQTNRRPQTLGSRLSNRNNSTETGSANTSLTNQSSLGRTRNRRDTSEMSNFFSNILARSLNRIDTERDNNRSRPEIMEVTYSIDNLSPSSNLVDLFRNINDQQDASNIITTHQTISRNTEIIPYQRSDIASDEEESCVICQDVISEGSLMRKIKRCSHSFHLQCLDTWLESHITCPTCRCDIRMDTPNNDQTIPSTNDTPDQTISSTNGSSNPVYSTNNQTGR